MYPVVGSVSFSSYMPGELCALRNQLGVTRGAAVCYRRGES